MVRCRIWVLAVVLVLLLAACGAAEPAVTTTPEPVVVTPTETPEPTPEVTETPEPTSEVTETPEPTSEVTETPEPTPEVTETPEPTPEVTETPEPTPEVTETPEPTPEVTETPEPTPEVTETPEPTPEVTETPEPSPEVTEIPAEPEGPFVDPAPVTDQTSPDETEALINSEIAVPDILTAEASGTLVKENSRAVIDYSHTEDGYVMVKYTAETDKRLKVIVSGPTTKYTYNLTQGQWTVFPLSDGNGAYKVTVYQSVDDKYASVLSLSFDVSLADEFVPFLRPNQYVNYARSSTAVSKAAELTAKLDDPLKKVEAVYDYVVATLSYDKAKAASVKSGYLPDLEQVLRDRKGICFDYAALMTAMLRSQNIPCKLVVGYAGTAYHAWISVWTAEHGWVDGVIYFDGSVWHRMDPTFASAANQREEIMKYIGDGANYTVKYLY